MKSKNRKILIIIPARLASSRFPNKPMKKIYGIPMIGHCYIRSIKSKLSSDCFVATPDLEIFNYIKLIGGQAVMTSHKHIMCNDRVVEATYQIEKTKNVKYDIIVNVQGDLPMIFPDMIDKLIMPLINNKKNMTTTMVEEIKNISEFYDRNRVKVIFDLNDNAILLTREPVPSNFKYKDSYKKFKHVAIRAYKRDIFKKISKLKITPIEKIEGIDDLRLIENNIDIKVVKTSKITETVDNKEDLRKVISMMKDDKLLKSYKKKYTQID